MNPAKHGSSRLDVRPVPLEERHRLVFTAFNALAGDAVLTVVTDHEPRPLRLRFEAMYPERFVFAQRQFGIGHWEIALRRASAAGGLGDLAAFLHRCAVLTGARPETFAVLERHGGERVFRTGESIVEQDAHWPYLGLLRSGSLATVMASTSGREQKLFDVLSGETFGIVETLDGGRTVARIAVTSTVARAILFPRGVILSAMAADACFARSLTMICAQRTRRLAERYTDHHVQPAIARVAAAILPYAVPDTGLAPALEPLRRMTQAQLALTAGTAKEVAARAIADLVAAGAIERAGGRISRIDRTKLETFAGRR